MKKNYAKLSLGITEARSELKRSIVEAGDEPIALLQNNKIIAYIVPPNTFEKLCNNQQD
jgi:PHD/YefM family antitoxin component YafN of YafNO toxin-antitoxin module